MRLRGRIVSGPDEVFSSTAFNNLIGVTQPLTMGDRVVGAATVLAVEVAPDGTWADITYQLKDHQ